MVKESEIVPELNGRYKINLYAPENLDLESLLLNSRRISNFEKELIFKESPRSPNERNFLKKIAIFIDRLKWCEVIKKDKSYYYHTFNSKTLCQNMSCTGKELKIIKDILVKTGVIEINESFSIGQFSQSYRFEMRYHGKRPKLVDFGFTFSERELAKLGQKAKANTENEEWLLENMKLISFDIGREELISLAKAKPGECFCEANRETVKLQQSIYIDAILAPKTNPRIIGWHFGRSNSNGRLFNTISSLKRALRKHVTISGEKAVEIDQSASQPFLLLSFYKNISGEDARLESLKYHALWEKGFYESFSTLSGSGISKEEMKKVIVEGILNSKYTDIPSIDKVRTPNKELKKIVLETFMREFPILWADVVKLKTLKFYKGTFSRNNDIHAQFARHMQDFEASIFIDTICPKLKTLNIPCYTVHDCIGVREQDRETAKKVIEDTIEEVIGFKAYVK